MDENSAEGTIRNIGGKVQEGLGRATGDAKTQAQGVINQASGAAQDLYGQAKHTITDAADTASDKIVSAGDWVRHYIETQPYTAALIALGIGWLLGRTHRPV